MARARDELVVVDVLMRGNHGVQAASRAYYAVFDAADAALVSIGQARSKHGAVIAAFGQFVVKQGGFDPAIARTLRQLFELRNAADYDVDQPLSEIGDVLAPAAAFVAAVAAWLER